MDDDANRDVVVDVDEDVGVDCDGIVDVGVLLWMLLVRGESDVESDVGEDLDLYVGADVCSL